MSANINVLINIKDKFSAPLRKLKSKINKLKNGIKKNPIDIPFNTKSFSSSLLNMKNLFIGGFVGSILAGSVAVASGFDSSMSQVSALTGATGNDLAFFSEQAKEIGASTTLSASQAADAFTIIGSKLPQLLKSKEALAGVTAESVKLAEAAKIEMPQAANAIAATMNQFKLSASEVSSVVDTLAAGSLAGAANVGYLDLAIQKSGAAAKGAGISFQDTIAAIETIAPSVEEPTTAGLNLKNIFVKLAGEADRFNPRIVGLSSALDNLAKEGFGDITNATKKFGRVNAIAASELISQRDRFVELQGAVRKTGVATEQQRINTDNMGASMKSFSSRVEALQITLFSQNKTTRAFVDIGTDMVGMLTDNLDIIGILVAGFFAYKTITTAITIAKGIYTAFTIAQTAATGGLTIAQWALNIALNDNPIGLVIIGITLLIAGFVLAYKKSETFRASVWGLWEGIKVLGNNLYSMLIEPFMALGTILDGIVDVFSGKGFGKIWEGIKQLGASLVSLLLMPLLNIVGAIDAVAGTSFAVDLKEATGIKSLSDGVENAVSYGFKNGQADFKKDNPVGKQAVQRDFAGLNNIGSGKIVNDTEFSMVKPKKPDFNFITSTQQTEDEESIIPIKPKEINKELETKRDTAVKNTAKVVGDTKVAKSITFNIGKLNESINITTTKLEEKTLDIEKAMTEVLLKAIRNVEQIA